MSKNLINFSDLTKKEIFDLIELAHNFKSEGSQEYRNEAANAKYKLEKLQKENEELKLRIAELEQHSKD